MTVAGRAQLIQGQGATLLHIVDLGGGEVVGPIPAACHKNRAIGERVRGVGGSRDHQRGSGDDGVSVRIVEIDRGERRAVVGAAHNRNHAVREERGSMVPTRGGKPYRRLDEGRSFGLEQFERVLLTQGVLSSGDEHASIVEQSRGMSPTGIVEVGDDGPGLSNGVVDLGRPDGIAMAVVAAGDQDAPVRQGGAGVRGASGIHGGSGGEAAELE